jgi:large subunit ribosomal protein L23
VTLTAQDIILHPVISEKSMDESQRGKYTFAVHDDANKVQIAAAVEELFKVEVVSVNVLTTKSKEKKGGMRRSRLSGRTTPWRKAIVTLVPGQKIEFFEAV